MVVRIYWASVTGNRTTAANQARIRNLVESLNVETEWIDITTSSDVRQEMRKECGIDNAMPPQLFLDEQYLGDMDDMELAVEEGRIRQWFGVQVPDDIEEQENKKETKQEVKEDKKQEISKPVTYTTTKVIFPRSKTNHINKSTLNENDERKKKILGL